MTSPVYLLSFGLVLGDPCVPLRGPWEKVDFHQVHRSRMSDLSQDYTKTTAVLSALVSPQKRG